MYKVTIGVTTYKNRINFLNDCIVSILNHPHFRLCKSVKDIEASSNFVKDFNLRFETGENLIQE